jgi:predicted MFS family arabinose efflux permease
MRFTPLEGDRSAAWGAPASAEWRMNADLTRAQRLDAGAHLALGTAAGLGAAFFAVLDTRLGASPWLLAVIAGAPYVGSLLAPVWVRQGQRLGIRTLMVTSLIASAITLALIGLAQGPGIFAFLTLLYFLLYSVDEPLYVALAERIYPERTGSHLGRIQAIFNGSRAAAGLLAGWLFDHWGRLATLLLAAATTVGAALLYVPLPMPASEQSRLVGPWRILREDRMVQRMALFFMVSGTGMVMMLPVLPIVEVRLARLSNGEIGALLAVNGAALLVASWALGALIERHQHLLPALRLSLAAIVGMALLYAFGRSFLVLLIANVLCGVGGAGIAVVWRLIAIQFPAYRTDELSGLHLLSCGVRGLYAPFLGVALLSLGSVVIPLLTAAALVALGSLLLLPGASDLDTLARQQGEG